MCRWVDGRDWGGRSRRLKKVEDEDDRQSNVIPIDANRARFQTARSETGPECQSTLHQPTTTEARDE